MSGPNWVRLGLVVGMVVLAALDKSDLIPILAVLFVLTILFGD